jgi:hypothetical protein
MKMTYKRAAPRVKLVKWIRICPDIHPKLGDDQARVEVEEITEVGHGFVQDYHRLRFSAQHFASASSISPIPLRGGCKIKDGQKNR